MSLQAAIQASYHTVRSIDLDGVRRKVYSFIDCSITDAAHIIGGIF